MKHSILIFSLFCWMTTLTAQPEVDRNRDKVWIFGSDNSTNIPGVDGSIVDFSSDPPITSYVNKPIEQYTTDASICDKEGNLILYTNGLMISNRNHQILANSEDFYSGPYVEGLGLPMCQGALFLPMPESDSLYILIHPLMKFAEPLGGVPIRLQYSMIDMSRNGGDGEAILLNHLIINDTLDWGHLTACRHANGRDWWILIPELVSNRFYRLLLDPEGLHLNGEQRIGDVLGTLLTVSQAVFSPNGTQYVRSRGALYYLPDTMAVYDFDRCTGLLSNPVTITHTTDSLLVGSTLAISPNSRFLYKTLGLYMWQYDLQAPDIATSRLLVHTATQQGFFAMQLAPDGKIYASTSGYSPYLHRIDYPDLPGPACGVCEICVPLPSYNWYSMPNFPNFRLGPVDGSVCDSLGINVGLEEVEVSSSGEQVELWPNPFNETLHIETLGNKAGLFRLYDQLGRVVLESKTSQSNDEVGTAHLPPGLYFWEFWLPGMAKPASGKCIKIGD